MNYGRHPVVSERMYNSYVDFYFFVFGAQLHPRPNSRTEAPVSKRDKKERPCEKSGLAKSGTLEHVFLPKTRKNTQKVKLRQAPSGIVTYVQLICRFFIFCFQGPTSSPAQRSNRSSRFKKRQKREAV